MSTFFISDLHFGHKNILKFAGDYRKGETIEEHDEWIIDNWNKTCNKRDLIWVLGDVAMDYSHLYKMDRLKGTKRLILGNHDSPDMKLYMPYFTEIWGMCRYKEFWLTHCPIHPDEFRKKKYNIYGHCHQNHIKNDPRYICVCVEQVNGIPLNLDILRKRLYG